MSPSLLHLDSSAHRGAESITRRLTALFARQWRSRHGAAGYRHRDLAAQPVAPIGEAYCDLGRRVERRGLALARPVEELIGTADERREWDLTRVLVDELLAADVLLVGAPMYNFSVPASLKAWIDRITFPGVFTGRTDGSLPLAHLRVVVVTSCGGAYRSGSDAERRDFVAPYLRAYFARQGVPAANVEVVAAELALAGLVPDRAHLRPLAARSFADAQNRLIDLAEAS